MRIAVVHGPNLGLLGRREPGIYGTITLQEIDEALREMAGRLDVEIETFQSNHEGEILDHLEEISQRAQGILINPAGLTHTSVSLRDALAGIALPCVEVHLSNPAAREEFRRISFVAPVSVATVAGFGKNSYLFGLQGLVSHLSDSPEKA
ncbi:type II 3-dehydroquinate dehydratase [Gemmatimonadota bacterium]